MRLPKNKLTTDEINNMLLSFKHFLESGWGIEVSKRRSGITPKISRELDSEVEEFVLLKIKHRKQNVRNQNAKKEAKEPAEPEVIVIGLPASGPYQWSK